MPVSTLQVLQYSPEDGTWEPTPGYEGTVVSDFWRDVFPPEAVCWWAVGWLGGDVVYYSWQAENACSGEVLMPGVVGELPGPPGVMGPPGPPGSAGPPGPALQFVGVWDTNTTYQPGQVVTYDNGTNNETWVANVTNTASAPVTGNPNWSLLPSTPGATGPQGPPGPTGAQGPPGTDGSAGVDGNDGQGFVWTGAWTVGSSYVPYDVVTYQGSSYVCILANSGSVPPPSAQWQLQAQAGTPGAPGTPGSTGPQGPPGQGVPSGGSQLQLLFKNSSVNYDTSWQTLSPQLPPPITTGNAWSSYTDPMGTLWIAKGGVLGGAWRRAIDVLHAKWGMAGAFSIPAADTTVPLDTQYYDTYGLWVPGSVAFGTPIPGIWRLTSSWLATQPAAFYDTHYVNGGALNAFFRQSIGTFYDSTTHVSSHYLAAGNGTIQAAVSSPNGPTFDGGAQFNYVLLDYIGTGT